MSDIPTPSTPQTQMPPATTSGDTQQPVTVTQQTTTTPQSHAEVVQEEEKLEDELVEEKKTNAWTNPLLIGLSVCALFIVGAIIWLLFNKTKVIHIPQIITQLVTATPAPTKAYTTMSGIITFEGYAPIGSYFAISERTHSTVGFKDVVSGLIPKNGIIPWTWNNAVEGKNYEIQAHLKVQGKTVQASASQIVSAPATNANLILISEQSPPQPQQTTLSGLIHLDGYIPTGSTISIMERMSGSGNYTTVVSGLAAQDGVQWSWNNANSGEAYDLQVQLLNASGIPISTNVSQTVTAPSSGLTFYISSSAQPPVPAITGISGTININGSIPSNSYITLGTRTSIGTVAFSQVGSNIAASNGVTWSWGAAQSGAQYDVQAYLWVNGQPYAQSNIITVTAPSQNNILNINAQQQLAAPSGNTISVTCNGQQNNVFQATINYNTQTNLTNPSAYNIVVTLASQGSQVLNTTVTPGNPTQSQSLTTTYIFTPGTTYYAQYAYSMSNNSSTLSPLSPAIQFSCN